MKFRFPLDTVLKHRQRLEEEAQRAFAEAQAAVDECLRTIEAMYKRLDEAREEVLAAQQIGTSEKVEEVRILELFINGQKLRIEQMRQRARELLAIAEEKQELLIEAAKEKKVLVKLKERRLAEHRERLREIETKEMDDLAMVRRAWSKA